MGGTGKGVKGVKGVKRGPLTKVQQTAFPVPSFDSLPGTLTIIRLLDSMAFQKNLKSKNLHVYRYYQNKQRLFIYYGNLRILVK